MSDFFSSLLKGVYSKRKEFAPRGANSFLLEQTHFQKGLRLQEGEQTKS